MEKQWARIAALLREIRRNSIVGLSREMEEQKSLHIRAVSGRKAF
jgi:hypothetical protein